jgi:hypothetical protein
MAVLKETKKLVEDQPSFNSGVQETKRLMEDQPSFEDLSTGRAPFYAG